MTWRSEVTMKRFASIRALHSSYAGRAGSWLARKENARAVADYDAAIQVDPKNAVAYVGGGRRHSARSEYTQAVGDFSEAIWLDPLSTSAYCNRGRAWQSKHEYAKAIVDYNVAAGLIPNKRPLIASVAMPGKVRRAFARPSQITARQFGSIRNALCSLRSSKASGDMSADRELRPEACSRLCEEGV